MLMQKTVSEFFTYMNDQNLKGMEKLLKDDAELYFPKTQPLLGKDQIIRFLRILFRQYTELVFQPKKTIIQGNAAAIHWTNQGINRKNESYENEGVTILEVEKEQIRFISDFFKDTGKF